MGNYPSLGSDVCHAIRRLELGLSACGDIERAVQPFAEAAARPDIFIEDSGRVYECLSVAQGLSRAMRGYIQFFIGIPEITSRINRCARGNTACDISPMIDAMERGVFGLMAPYHPEPYPKKLDALLRGLMTFIDRLAPYNDPSLSGRVDFIVRNGRPATKIEKAGHTIEVHADHAEVLTLFRVEKGMAFPKDVLPLFSFTDYLSYKAKGFDRRKFNRDIQERDKLIRRQLYAQASALGHIELSDGEIHTGQRDHNCFAETFHSTDPDRDRYFHPLEDGACHHPATHIQREGWKPIDLRIERARPGDLLIYFAYVPIKSAGLPAEYNEAHTFKPFNYLRIRHAAVIILSDENGVPLLARHKFDQQGPLTLGSPFSVPIEYGDAFAVMRRETAKSDDTDFLGWP